MAEKKMTKKDYFKQIKELVVGNVDLENFINHELELLEKKSSSKAPTKVQIENENLKELIVEVLSTFERPATISDIQSANDELAKLSNQKISALLTQLVNAKTVVRTIDKKKAYFSLKSE